MGTRKTAGIGKWIVAAMLAASGSMAQAGSAEDAAFGGAVADGVSTAVGLAAGAVELNPIGPVLAVGAKVVLFRYAKTLPEIEQPRVYAAAASLWQGAAANNLCIAAALLSGGSFTPVCVALGIAWGAKTWHDTQPEREFWQACAMMRDVTQQPELTCIYVPPGHATALAAGEQVPASLQASVEPTP